MSYFLFLLEHTLSEWAGAGIGALSLAVLLITTGTLIYKAGKKDARISNIETDIQKNIRAELRSLREAWAREIEDISSMLDAVDIQQVKTRARNK